MKMATLSEPSTPSSSVAGSMFSTPSKRNRNMASPRRNRRLTSSKPGSAGPRNSTHKGKANMRKTNHTNYAKPIEHEISTGNIFADLGLPHPQEALAKAQLARAICLLIEKENLTQSAIAQRL